MLFIGLTPQARSLARIQSGEVPIFTFLTALAVYLGHKAGFSTLTDT